MRTTTRGRYKGVHHEQSGAAQVQEDDADLDRVLNGRVGVADHT
jgi:hypothetical protein